MSHDAAGRFELRFVTEVPYMAIDGDRFEFPGAGGDPDIALHLVRSEERRTLDGLAAAADGLWAGPVLVGMIPHFTDALASIATWTITGLDAAPTGEDVRSVWWPRCVGILDEVSFAYRVATGWGVGELSVAYLQRPVFHSSYEDGEPVVGAGMIVPPSPEPDDVLGPDRLSRIAETVFQRFVGMPMVESRRWVERARDDMGHAFYATAVIALQTSVEVFFGEILQMILLDTQAWDPPPDLLDPTGSFSKLTNAVAALVGGSWDRTAPGPWGDYWRDLYELRNRVIHAGLRPTSEQAEAAFAAHVAMMAWFRDELLARPKRFTRTILVYPGFPALEVDALATAYLRSQLSHWTTGGRRYWTDEPPADT